MTTDHENLSTNKTNGYIRSTNALFFYKNYFIRTLRLKIGKKKEQFKNKLRLGWFSMYTNLTKFNVQI